MESLAINASYISIANFNIIRGRQNGTIAWVDSTKGTTTRVAWTSVQEFNAPTKYNHGSIINFGYIEDTIGNKA